MHRGGEKITLDIHSLQISHRITGAETNQAHCLLTVECLLPRRQIDIKILRRIVIVHIAGHVKAHAAHQVDQLDKDIQIDQHISVRTESHAFGNIFQQRVHTLLALAIGDVCTIDLMRRIGGIDFGVARNTHKADLAALAVDIQQHQGIRAVARGVRSGQKNGRAAAFAGKVAIFIRRLFCNQKQHTRQ